MTIEQEPKELLVLHVVLPVSERGEGMMIAIKLFAISWLVILKDTSYLVTAFMLVEKLEMAAEVMSPILQA